MNECAGHGDRIRRISRRDTEALNEAEREQLVDFLAHNPLAGDLIAGTGGVRKLRWALEGRGKRGGGRVIYFFHSEKLPLYIFSMYAKNVQSDLGPVLN